MSSKDTDPPLAADPATAPDPDEDDLDDLDDMLDEFSATKIDSSKPPATAAPDASGPGRPAPPPAAAAAAPPAGFPPGMDPIADDTSPEDFAKQLQEGMAQMLQDLETNPDMAKQFEEMLTQFGAPPVPSAAAEPQTAAPGSAAASATAKPSEDAFQDTIRRTMDRMKASSSSADAAATAEPSPFDDDMMAALMRELQSGSGDGEGDDGFSKMLLGMMEQLTNKDILYEPMKELNAKFPAWLAEKGDSLPKEERERYETQQVLVKDIVERFERDGYKDENPDDREYIVERMQKMQAAGAPPPDLVGDVDAANEMIGGLDQGCAQQ